jgi:pyruvate kinase
MPRHRRVRIVATIGPACRDRDTLAAMLDAGMDVARLNMSHGDQDEHARTFSLLRELSRSRQRPLALLQDLSGPKIRIGKLEVPIALNRGDRIRLGRAGIPDVLPLNDPALTEQVAVSDRLSLADGTFLLEVVAVSDGVIEAEVVEGSGTLTSHKGVNIPRLGRSTASMTAKDREDLRFGLEQGFDWIAMSFVRSAEDAELARAEMDRCGRRAPLLAKIEKPEAVERIAEIVETFDGLLVARGDLGVETSLERVPGIQKELIRRANAAAKPVVTATQMLLSMVASPRPTRAEVADVTAAVLDGTDAVMLSDETAAGDHPVEAVRALAAICAEAESLRSLHAVPSPPAPEAVLSASEGIGRIVPRLASLIGAKLIVAPTLSGATARRVAAMKPGIPILAISSNPATVRRLSLTWGVTAREIPEADGTDALFQVSRREALAVGAAAPGDRIVITAGSPTGVSGSTDLIKVEEL